MSGTRAIKIIQKNDKDYSKAVDVFDLITIADAAIAPSDNHFLKQFKSFLSLYLQRY